MDEKIDSLQQKDDVTSIEGIFAKTSNIRSPD